MTNPSIERTDWPARARETVDGWLSQSYEWPMNEKLIDAIAALAAEAFAAGQKDAEPPEDDDAGWTEVYQAGHAAGVAEERGRIRGMEWDSACLGLIELSKYALGDGGLSGVETVEKLIQALGELGTEIAAALRAREG